MMFTYFTQAFTESDISTPEYFEVRPVVAPEWVTYLPFIYAVGFMALVAIGRYVLKKFR